MAAICLLYGSEAIVKLEQEMGAQRSFRSTARPDVAGKPASELEVTVVFTDVQATLAALRQAACLARDLNATIRLLVPLVVPYPLPLESPPVAAEFSERRFRILAEDQRVDAHIQICLCRDRDRLLEEVLPCGSIIVIGGPGHWRLARKLRRRGHDVLIAKMEEKRAGSVLRSDRRGIFRRCLDVYQGL